MLVFVMVTRDSKMNENFRFKLFLYEIKQEKMAHFNLTVGLGN